MGYFYERFYPRIIRCSIHDGLDGAERDIRGYGEGLVGEVVVIHVPTKGGADVVHRRIRWFIRCVRVHIHAVHVVHGIHVASSPPHNRHG